MKQKKGMELVTERTVDGFRRELLRREYSHGTAESYVRSIRAFARWSGGAVDRGLVLTWKAQLTAQYAPATVNAMLAGINRFFAFMGWPECKVKALRLQRRSFREAERELDREEYRTLVRTARTLGRERLALVMETICATGIRVGEVPYITVEALRRGKAVVALKGKVRTILLPEKLCKKLLKYVKRQKITSGEVFLTGGGKRLSRVQIWAEMKRLCCAAGVAADKVFPHNLRHLFARTFYRACQDVVKLADILGHSSIETTRIYLLTTGAEHLRRLERLGLLC
jgi:integrase/recombinase XerD